jgi:hypothetical protein
MSLEAEAYVELACEQLTRARVLHTRAAGYSMWPSLRVGQRVRILPCPSEPAVLGDVVLVARGPKLVLHRVVGVRPNAVLLQGDALPRPDGWVPRTALLGRLGRSPLDALLGRLAPWISPALFLCALAARKLVKPAE